MQRYDIRLIWWDNKYHKGTRQALGFQNKLGLNLESNLLQNCKTRLTDFWPPPGFVFGELDSDWLFSSKNIITLVANEKCLMQNIFCQCPGLCPVLFIFNFYPQRARAL